MLQEVISTVKNVEQNKQTAVFKHITTLCEHHSDAMVHEHIFAICSIAEAVVDTADSSVVAECARIFAGLENVSPDLIQHLGKCEIEIARDILVKSKVLDDIRLADIIETTSEKHRSAIALREELSSTITDLLIAFNERSPSLLALQNKGASFSDKGFFKLSELCGSDTKMARAMGNRGDLPRELVPVVSPNLPSKERARLRSAIEVAQGIDLSSEIRKIGLRAQEKSFSPANVTLLTNIRSGSGNKQRILNNLVQDNRLSDLVQVLAGLLYVPEKVVHRAVFGKSGTHVALLCRAADMPIPLFRNLTEARLKNSELPLVALESLVKQYIALPKETALTALERLRAALNSK